MTDFERVLNPNLTTDAGVAPEFTGVLQRYMLENIHDELVYEQFADLVKVEKGKTNHVAWDRVNQLPTITTALEEGVTPDGSKLTIERVEGSAVPYGNYLSFTDEFDQYAMDPSKQLVDKSGILADQATATFDELAGKVLASGTNVQYANDAESRGECNTKLKVEDVRKAVRTLKGNKAPKINGSYIAIVHTDVAHDLMSDNDWKAPHTYSDTKELYNGEIGMLYGVRFIETPTGVVFKSTPFSVGGTPSTYITIDHADSATKKVYLEETILATDLPSLKGRGFFFQDAHYDIIDAGAGANGTAFIQLPSDTDMDSFDSGAPLSCDGGNADGENIYATLVFGANAFGITKLNDNLEVIYKGLGEGDDPLNQRSTLGWKARFLAKILQPLFLVRIESTSTR